MKKLKLFTALATAGMTTGILLPLVTSCNVATTGEIKFKLGEGVTAKANPFKVGDKVVVNYDVTDKNYIISLDSIVVKFDGWKVEQSNKTWKLDTRKCTITIFSAPTTDITIKISCSEEGGTTLRAIFLAESENCTVYNSGGVVTEIDSFNCPSTFTTYGEVLNYISGSYDVVIDDGYTWNGSWETEDGTLITNNMAIDWDVAIRPRVINDEEEGFTENDKVTLSCEPIYYNENPYYIGSFLVLEGDTQTSCHEFSTFISETSNATLADFLDEKGEGFLVEPSIGCAFKGWYIDDEESSTDPEDIVLANFRKGATEQHTLTAKFDMQEDIYKMEPVTQTQSGDPIYSITLTEAIAAYQPVYLLWDGRAQETLGNKNTHNINMPEASAPGIYLKDDNGNLVKKFGNEVSFDSGYNIWCLTNPNIILYLLGDDGTISVTTDSSGLTLYNKTNEIYITDPCSYGIIIVRICFSEDIPANSNYKICFGEVPVDAI